MRQFFIFAGRPCRRHSSRCGPTRMHSLNLLLSLAARRLLAFCSAVHVFNGVHAYPFRFWRANSTHNTITSKGCSSAPHHPCHSLSLARSN